jgi:hypothetical protein
MSTIMNLIITHQIHNLLQDTICIHITKANAIAVRTAYSNV